MAKLSFELLRLRNFKVFRGEHELQVKQSPGLYHVSGKNSRFPGMGPNGVGKSTLLADAPLWILFGKTIRDKMPGNAVVPWSGEKNVYGLLGIRRGRHKFQIERTRSPNSLTLIEGEERREISQDEVPKLIGMSEEMFRRTVILGQFGVLFLDLRPDAQAQMFSEALSLEVYLKAADIAKLEATRYREHVERFEKEVAELQAAIKELTESMKEARKREDAFDTKRSKNIADLEKALRRLKKDLLAEEARLPNKEPKLPSVSPVMHQILEKQNEKREEIGALKSTASARNDQIEEWEQECRSMKVDEETKCSQCGQSMSWDHFQKLVRKISKKILEAQEKNIAADKKIAKLNEDIIDLKAAQEEEDMRRRAEDKVYQDARDAYRMIERAIADIKAVISASNKSILQLQEQDNEAEEEWHKLRKRRQKKRARVEEIETELEICRLRLDRAEFWMKAYKEIRLTIIDEALVELEIASARHAGLLGLEDWGIRFETERETSQGNLSYKFTVMLYPPDQKKPIKWESYSGGESQRLQLAVAFGLSEVLLSRAGVDPNFEVLDEPTRGLSPEGISDLLEHLRDRAMELGRTIYLVDHHALDRGAFDGTLLVTQKAKGGSQFKWL